MQVHPTDQVHENVSPDRVPITPNTAAAYESQKPAVPVDSQTTSVPEVSEQKPAPLVLTPESRPIPEVFQNIVNFRDVGQSVRAGNDGSGGKYIALGKFFRSGRLDDATTADLNVLVAQYGVKSVIDLRSKLEGKMGRQLTNTFPASAIAELKFNEMMTVSTENMVETSEENGKTYFINFAGQKFRKYSVWKPAPLYLKIEAIFLMLFFQKRKLVKKIGRKVIQPRGLIGLNKDFVDYCYAEIICALKIMCKPQCYPVLVHCTQGKDRTGLVVALALIVAGVPENEIVRDYAKSQAGLARQRDIMVREMAKTGLDSTFSDSPPEIMIGTLKYLWDKYGGPIAYLNKFGFNSEFQAALKQKPLFQINIH